MKKRYYLIMAVILVLVIVLLNGGIPKKLDSPVFVKNLVCSCDMDAEVEFITNNNYKLKVKDIEIPDMPDGLHLDFYDEQVDEWSKYDVHVINFGIGADELSEDGGLKEDFIFHEIIVKWEDGTETKADIGTIHMTANSKDFLLDNIGTEHAYPSDNIIETKEFFVATQKMNITDISIPYSNKVPDFITDIYFNGESIESISEETPVTVKKGDQCELTYTIDNSEQKQYGRIFIEGVITGKTSDGESFLDKFYINGSVGRHMPDWAEEQIANEK